VLDFIVLTSVFVRVIAVKQKVNKFSSIS